MRCIASKNNNNVLTCRPSYASAFAARKAGGRQKVTRGASSASGGDVGEPGGCAWASKPVCQLEVNAGRSADDRDCLCWIRAGDPR
eukprot:363978-Chlamydomonas_euryale.AAC.1